MNYFQKVTIMPKGESPKVKGALCNVPVGCVDVANILPRKPDSNGIVLVKLKHKLEYREHVLFEGVRPDFVFRLLQYLKSHNPLYREVEINIKNIPSDIIVLNDNSTESNVCRLSNWW